MPSPAESHPRLVDHAQQQEELATLVHDLRNPLYAISVYVEILTQEEAGPLTAAQHDLLQRIRHNCQELERLLTVALPSPAAR
jgi:two-component system, OmpR family, phosphate regulon sensor histidine kinase PhoR